MTDEERDHEIDEFIELVGAVDGILQVQAAADTEYFVINAGRPMAEQETAPIEAAFLKAYRWQYIHSGAAHPKFVSVLSSMITEDQGRRIEAALAKLR